MKIKTETLLKQLDSVMPGVSSREIIEQSSCFVFDNGTVSTFNDEIACSHETDLKFKGAVPASPFITILRKLEEEFVDIDVLTKKKQIVVKGKSKRARIQLESDILLPIESVNKPKKWKDLPDDFADAVNLVFRCSSRNESQFVLTCINIHPNWLESTDNYQAARYKINMDIKKPILVRSSSLSNIISLDMRQFSIRKSWIHFKNSEGLILSCRLWKDDFPTENLTTILTVKGKTLKLPKTLKEAAERAEVFSSEATDNVVTIKLLSNKIGITGKCGYGSYHEAKKIKYRGKDLTFTISPQLLSEMVTKYDKCKVTNSRMFVQSGKLIYVTVLGVSK